MGLSSRAPAIAFDGDDDDACNSGFRRRASFLIVDDNRLARRALAQILTRYGSCRFAACVADAIDELASGQEWHGFVFDVRLGDGSGLDVLSDARRVYARTPALVISGNLDHESINRAALLDARLVSKPYGESELAPFLSDVFVYGTRERVYAATERARLRWGLSPREAEIIEATLRGRPRDELLASTKMTLNTYKTHVRKLLEKVDYENLASLAIDLLAEN